MADFGRRPCRRGGEIGEEGEEAVEYLWPWMTPHNIVVGRCRRVTIRTVEGGDEGQRFDVREGVVVRAEERALADSSECFDG
jgi:hypothetical protein